MPIHWKITTPSSNKQALIPAGKISYQYKGKIAVLRPIIDKIAVVCKLHDDVVNVLVESLLQEIAVGATFKSAKFTKGSINYKAAAKLLVSCAQEEVLVQVGPKTSSVKHSLRLEFNPAKLGPAGIVEMKNALEALCPATSWGLKYSSIVTAGKVTRLDIAVDIIGIAPHDLDYRGIPGKKIWYLSDGGKMETAYFGIKPPAKNAKWTAYNKRVHLKEEGSPDMAYGGLSHTRIEYRDAPHQTISKLYGRPNPFVTISVADALAFKPAEAMSHSWMHFVDSCNRRGHEQALAAIEDVSLRQQYTDALKSAHEAFWKPHDIWKYWPETIEKSGLVGS